MDSQDQSVDRGRISPELLPPFYTSAPANAKLYDPLISHHPEKYSSTVRNAVSPSLMPGISPFSISLA